MNEYDKLLDFLDNIKEINKEAEQVKIPLKKVEVTIDKTKEETVSKALDKVIEESQISDIFETPQIIQTIKGFDVTRFENLMRSKLIDEYKKMQSYERPYISVTELFSCMRSNYYARLKYQVDIKDLFKFAYLKMIQEVGNTIHTVVQTVYDFTEVEKTIISEKFSVKGRVDALKENYLYEIKTLDEDKFNGEFRVNDFQQGNIYSFILNNEYNLKIDTVVLLYFFRSNLKKRAAVFELKINNKEAEFYLSKGKALLNYIQRKEVPDVIGADEEQCKYCLFKKFCEKDESKTEKPFNKKVEKIIEKPKTVFLM